MPSVTVAREEITTDQAMAALRQQLGDRYTVTATDGSPDVFKVKTGAMSQAKVHIRRQAGATQFHVSGLGIIIGRIINELGIARQVAAAIRQAPGLGDGR